MADCICDLGNIIDEESFNVRVIRELCDISTRLGTVELLRMVDQTDDGDVEFLRTTSGDFLLDGVTPYTPIGTVIPYKRNDSPVPSQYIVADSIQIPTSGYINTLVTAINSTTKSKFKVTWQGSSTGNRGLYGVRPATSVGADSYNVFLTVGSTGPRWDCIRSTSTYSIWSVGETHEVELTHTPEGYGQVIDNGVIVATGTQSLGSTPLDYIYINTFLTQSTSSVMTGGTMRWHYCQIWSDGTTLSANFVPVYDTVGQEAGFYDIARQQFFGNDGSGTITAYDAEGNPITGGNLLGISPNVMMKSNTPKTNITVIGPDDEEEER